MAQDNVDQKLDALFAQYRDACPEVDGGANFMPQLWQKIESRQSVPFVMGRFTKVFMSAAAALCLMMSLLMFAPSSSSGSATMMSYLEVLDQEQTLQAVYGAPADDAVGETVAQ